MDIDSIADAEACPIQCHGVVLNVERRHLRRSVEIDKNPTQSIVGDAIPLFCCLASKRQTRGTAVCHQCESIAHIVRYRVVNYGEIHGRIVGGSDHDAIIVFLKDVVDDCRDCGTWG